jgi:hypothetical protein
MRRGWCIVFLTYGLREWKNSSRRSMQNGIHDTTSMSSHVG